MIFLTAAKGRSVVRWHCPGTLPGGVAMLFAKLKEATAAVMESAAVMLLLVG